MAVTSFRDLEVWQHSMQLAKRVYGATATMPWPHRGEIGGQMRRASVSAASNVAEGFRQGSARAYLHYVRMAAGAVAELETQAELATDLQLWVVDHGKQIRDMSERSGRMLTGLASALERRSQTPCPACRRRAAADAKVTNAG